MRNPAEILVAWTSRRFRKETSAVIHLFQVDHVLNSSDLRIDESVANESPPRKYQLSSTE